MRDWVHCDEVANHQLPIAAAFWIIWIVSVEECSNLMQNLIQIRCSTCSVILNATATRYTCSVNRVYRPRWLVQWSHHCPHMCIPVHSPWLPGYMDVAQTILVLLTMAGVFLDGPLIYLYSLMLSLTSFSFKKESSTQEKIYPVKRFLNVTAPFFPFC